MINIVLVDPVLADAVVAEQRGKGPAAADLTVLWSGPDVPALMAARLEQTPDVMVLDRACLPADATAVLAELRQRVPARTLIVTYDFASTRDIDALRQAGCDIVLQGPLSVRTLRTFLLSMLIERRVQAKRDTRPQPGPSAEEAPIIPQRFPRAALVALRDMQSAIQCECPNHVAELVERLAAFEGYSKNCESRDDADAEIHRALWFATARARRMMEDALDKVLKHEGIIVEGTTVRRIAKVQA